MTTAVADLREISMCFDAEWTRARPITAQDLKQALAAWKRRRAARPAIKQVKSLADFTPADVRDRDLYIAIWSERPSPGADAAYQKVVSDAEERKLLTPSILERRTFSKQGLICQKTAFSSALNGTRRANTIATALGV